MIKHKFFGIDIRKEETWINTCIDQGYRLVNVKPLTGCYEFEKCTEKDNSYAVKIDFRTFKKREDFIDYLTLFEDSGWKHIAGSKSNGVQYFERIGDHASDDIFSDRASKTERYKRISNMWLGLFAAYIPILVALANAGTLDVKRMLHLKDLYYTPGLWEKSGSDFRRAFLFETPFALGRGFLGFLFLCFVLLYAYFGLKALYWYYKEK